MTVPLHSVFLNISTKWYTYSTVLVITWLVPHETAAALAHVLGTPFTHAPVYSATLFKATNTYGACAN